MRKVGRYDAVMIDALRAALVERYRERMAPITEPHQTTALVVSSGDATTGLIGFQDPDFVKVFGVGLNRVTDSTLLTLSMKAFMEKVHRGETIPYFEEER